MTKQPDRLYAKGKHTHTFPLTIILPIQLLLLLGLLPGCSSLYDKLKPEQEIPHLQSLLIQHPTFPTRVIRIDQAPKQAKPLHIAIEENGNGNNPRVIVLIHGVLSDRSFWRFYARALGPEQDLLLLDLPGCGASDKPNPEIVGGEFYGPESLARVVLATIEEVMGKRKSAPKITLVGHSLGGAITLQILGNPKFKDRFGQIIKQVDRAVLLAPADVAIEKIDRGMETIVHLSRFEVWLGSTLGILTSTIGRVAYEGAYDPSRCPREEADRFIEILQDREMLKAGQAMLRHAVPFDQKGRPDWKRVRELERLYTNVSIPCLLLWGRQDETLPVSMGHKLRNQIPGSRLWILEDCKHSSPIEYPELCARLTEKFNTTTGRTKNLVEAYAHKKID